MIDVRSRNETFATRPRSRYVWPEGLSPKLCAAFLTIDGGGDLFDCYKDQSPVLIKPLNHGTGFSGDWLADLNYYGLRGVEDFQVYALGGAPPNLHGPWGYSGSWSFGANYLGSGPGSSGVDQFETYIVSVPAGGLNDGTGWSSPWITGQGEGADPSKLSAGYDTFDTYADGPTTWTGNNGKLNYTGFVNWDVASGTVDLIGNSFWDFYPGQGLYVDTAGTPGVGVLQSKTAFTFTSGHSYRLTLKLGGNTRIPGDTSVQATTVGGLFSTTFVSHTYDPLSDSVVNFTPGSTTTDKLSFAASTPFDYCGTILAEVTLEDLTASVTLLHDNFDSENLSTQSLPYGGFGWMGPWVIATNS